MKKVDSVSSVPKFVDIQSKVFHEHGGKVYIGKEEATEQLRDILRDEAEYIIGSRLWEVFNASIINEAYTMALIQSSDFDAVLNAKMLHHWAHFMRNVLHSLAKK